MTAPVSCIRPLKRKLSDEIDRLNRILDGLGDALLAAITDAAREGSRVAVREAIEAERAKHSRRATPAPPARPIPSRPTIWIRFKAFLPRL
jgi:hypothetical protein